MAVLLLFGDCSVDPAARELRRAGVLVVLSPKVFDCLAYLIEHRDRAVGRDELIAAVWGRVNVSDALLGQAVLKARRAVGDTGDEQRAIRTIPRFGYRWVADILVEDADAAPALDEAAPANPTAAPPTARPQRGRRARVVGTLVLFLLLFVSIAAAPWLRERLRWTSATPAGAGSDVIGVLPVDIDAGPQWSWLRLGLMDLVAQHLRHAGLAVMPSDNIVAVIGDQTDNADAPSAGRHLRDATGVQRWLEAIARRDGDRWRVRLVLHADTAAIEVEAHAADAVAAARASAALLLQRLGKQVAATDERASASLDELRQRVEAAMLVDDLVGARRIIEAAPADVADTPELRFRLAQVDLRDGRIADARARLDRLLHDVTAEDDPVLRARIQIAVSTAAVHRGDLDAALRACGDAAELLGGHSEPAVLGRARTACGVANASIGRFDIAMNDFAQARIAFEITGDALSLARIEANEGLMEITRGRYADGLAVMLRSEQHFTRLGGRMEVIMAINDQVEAHLALLQPLDALASSERGWTLMAQIDNAEVRHGLQVQHARALAANGRGGEAAALLARVTAEADSAHERPVLGRARAAQAEIELESARVPAAIEHARTAVDLLVNPDDARQRAIAWRLYLNALRRGAQDAAATAQQRVFATWAGGTTIASVATYALLAEADGTAQTPQQAAMAYERALAAAEQTGIPLDIRVVAVAWGGRLLEAGQLDRASSVLGRVSRWAESDFDSSVAQAQLYRALGRESPWHDALRQARSLAGERTIPAAASGDAPVRTDPAG